MDPRTYFGLGLLPGRASGRTRVRHFYIAVVCHTQSSADRLVGHHFASVMFASIKPAPSRRQRILCFNFKLKLFFAVNEDVTVVLPLGCSLTAKAIMPEKLNVLGWFVFDFAYDSHKAIALLRSMCLGATSAAPFSISDFEKKALKEFTNNA